MIGVDSSSGVLSSFARPTVAGQGIDSARGPVFAPRRTGTRMSIPLEAPALSSAARPSIWPLVVLGGLLAWAYYPMLAVFADKWINDPQYSHGFLVPIFSGYLLRRAWKSAPVQLNPMP